MVAFSLAITAISCLIWCFLLGGWGNFWRCDQILDFENSSPLVDYASVAVIIPARDEADVLGQSLPSLLQQNYAGPLQIILVDDQSTDGTRAVAEHIAVNLGHGDRLRVIAGEPLPSGWSGKLWAVEQGWQALQELHSPPQYIFLTDADIAHGEKTITKLVQKATQENLALVSLMVILRCQSFWEKLLIPAFIFFFQKLYPFSLVNNTHRKTAAAAGGCILIERQALEVIGGIASLKEALIDDCTLAQKVKAKKFPIWLGLTRENWSLRPYDRLETIWQMVSRTAYSQLRYNPLILLVTLLGMVFVYLTAPVAILLGLVWVNWPLILLGTITWMLMAIAYGPTLKLYGRSLVWSFSLPLIAFLYSLMTLDSAWQHWRGQGGRWKGRVYLQGS